MKKRVRRKKEKRRKKDRFTIQTPRTFRWAVPEHITHVPCLAKRTQDFKA